MAHKSELYVLCELHYSEISPRISIFARDNSFSIKVENLIVEHMSQLPNSAADIFHCKILRRVCKCASRSQEKEEKIYTNTLILHSVSQYFWACSRKNSISEIDPT